MPILTCIIKRNIKMDNIVNLIPHCDDGSCDLGSLKYHCPSCNKKQINYDDWFELDNLYKDISIHTKCEDCNADLLIKFNNSSLYVYDKTV